jgi:hypothetical protein
VFLKSNEEKMMRIEKKREETICNRRSREPTKEWDSREQRGSKLYERREKNSIVERKGRNPMKRSTSQRTTPAR